MDKCHKSSQIESSPRHIPVAMTNMFELLDTQDVLIDQLHKRLISVLSKPSDECGGESTVDSGTPLADEIQKAVVKLRQHNARLDELLGLIEL